MGALMSESGRARIVGTPTRRQALRVIVLISRMSEHAQVLVTINQALVRAALNLTKNEAE